MQEISPEAPPSTTHLLALPLLADLLGVGLYFLLAAPLAGRLGQFGIGNSVLLGIVFVLFCLAVYALKKLQPVPGPLFKPARLLDNRRLAAALGVIFALCYALVIAYVTGFLDSVANLNRAVLDEPAAAIYLLLSPATWFGLALVYMLLLSTPVESTLVPGSRNYQAATLLGLLGVNLMAVVLSAFRLTVAGRFGEGGWLISVAVLLCYLLLLLPPRLIHAGRAGQPLSLLSFLLLLAFLAAV
jgi:hypothetical protein